MTQPHMNRELLGKAYRMEGLITAARLALDNDNWPELRKDGAGIAEVLEVMADLAADLSEGIDLLQNRVGSNVSVPIVGTAGG